VSCGNPKKGLGGKSRGVIQNNSLGGSPKGSTKTKGEAGFVWLLMVWGDFFFCCCFGFVGGCGWGFVCVVGAVMLVAVFWWCF